MMTIDIANTATVANEAVLGISKTAYECFHNQSTVNRISESLQNVEAESRARPLVENIAQQMLRNILKNMEQSKKHMYNLQCELQESGDYYNIPNNNNDNDENESDSDSIDNSPEMNKKNYNNNNNSSQNMNSDIGIQNVETNTKCEDEEIKDEEKENLNEVINLRSTKDSIYKKPTATLNGSIEDLSNDNVEKMSMKNTDHKYKAAVSPSNNNIPLDNSMHKLLSNCNNEDEDIETQIPKSTQSENNNKRELKRPHMENQISYLPSSPSLTPVNGCKKRKLYHPQQHDKSSAERFVDIDIMDSSSEDENRASCLTEVRGKVVEKDVLKNQLRAMKKQLSAMQQKYAELCILTDQDESHIAEATRDTNEDCDKNVITTSDKNHLSTHMSSTIDTSPYPGISPANMSSQTMSNKHLSNSMSQNAANFSHLNAHAFTPSSNFNNALSILRKLSKGQQHASETTDIPQNYLQSHHPASQHFTNLDPAINNTAAIYLGISQKLLEQDAFSTKEAHNDNAVRHHLHTSPPSPNLQESPRSAVTQSQKPSSQSTSSMPTVKSLKESSSSSMSIISSSPSQLQQSFLQPTKKKYMAIETTGSNSATATDNVVSNNSLDLEDLANTLKTEITTTLTKLIDTILTSFKHQNYESKVNHLNKDLGCSSQLLDLKSSHIKFNDRKKCDFSTLEKNTSLKSRDCSSSNRNDTTTNSIIDKSYSYTHLDAIQNGSDGEDSNFSSHQKNDINLSKTTTASHSILNSDNHSTSHKANSSSLNSQSIYPPSITLDNPYFSPLSLSDMRGDNPSVGPEQNEALSLVVAPKKKRHKVTDSRITPRTVSRILAQDCPSNSNLKDMSSNKNEVFDTNMGKSDSPPTSPLHSYQIPRTAPILPAVSLPTSVAIPNPSLLESQVVFPLYSSFFKEHQQSRQQQSSSPPINDNHMHHSPPITHNSSIFQAAILAAAQQQQQQLQQSHNQRGSSSPDFKNVLPNTDAGYETFGPGSDCNSMEYDGMLQIIYVYSSTLSPMHLRKAKLMFFWVRYPTSTVLKMYFPDIRFNKNNTAQLVKWFSNFREFYYIQMEKYARAAIADGVQNADDLQVNVDSDIYRVLNLHYNRNNHIEIPKNFRYVVEETLKEFFKAIQVGKDQDQSWKKPIYKVIGRLDDPVPEYFKSPNFLEHLE